MEELSDLDTLPLPKSLAQEWACDQIDPCSESDSRGGLLGAQQQTSICQSYWQLGPWSLQVSLLPGPGCDPGGHVPGGGGLDTGGGGLDTGGGGLDTGGGGLSSGGGGLGSTGGGGLGSTGGGGLGSTGGGGLGSTGGGGLGSTGGGGLGSTGGGGDGAAATHESICLRIDHIIMRATFQLVWT